MQGRAARHRVTHRPESPGEPATLTATLLRDTWAPGEMHPTEAHGAQGARLENQSGVRLFRAALAEKPVRSSLGLAGEYLTFGSAVFMALSLYATRKPMAAVDRALGLRLRERFVDFIARVSPG